MAAKMTKWFEWSIVIFAGALFAIVGFELSVDGFDSMGLGAHDIPLGILGGAAIGFWVATILYRMLKRRHPTAFTEQ